MVRLHPAPYLVLADTSAACQGDRLLPLLTVPGASCLGTWQGLRLRQATARGRPAPAPQSQKKRDLPAHDEKQQDVSLWRLHKGEVGQNKHS